ncbi:MAG: hypothetical protein RJA07_456 [Bacteroidota bacterium]|jgi:hypothetical protein
MNQSTIVLKPYSVKEISELYNVSLKTFKKWLEPFEGEVGKKRGRYYTVLQVHIIFGKLGTPYFQIEEK